MKTLITQFIPGSISNNFRNTFTRVLSDKATTNFWKSKTFFDTNENQDEVLFNQIIQLNTDRTINQVKRDITTTINYLKNYYTFEFEYLSKDGTSYLFKNIKEIEVVDIQSKIIDLIDILKSHISKFEDLGNFETLNMLCTRDELNLLTCGEIELSDYLYSINNDLNVEIEKDISSYVLDFPFKALSNFKFCLEDLSDRNISCCAIELLNEYCEDFPISIIDLDEVEAEINLSFEMYYPKKLDLNVAA